MLSGSRWVDMQQIAKQKGGGHEVESPFFFIYITENMPLFMGRYSEESEA